MNARTIIPTLMHATGLPHIMRLRQRNRLVVVLYHGVTDDIGTGIFNYRGKFVSTHTFNNHLDYFTRHHTVLGLDEAVRLLFSESPLPSYPLCITFDDGYRNFFTHAAPLLKQYRMAATMFLTTSFIDTKKPLWVDRLEYAAGHGIHPTLPDRTARAKLDAQIRSRLKQLPDLERESTLSTFEEKVAAKLVDFDESRSVYAPLSWSEVETLEKEGMMFGAHSVHHPILTRLTPEALRVEVGESRECVTRRCKKSSSVFAYPNGQSGDYDEVVTREVRACGFTAALTTIPGNNKKTTSPYALKRYTMSTRDVGASFIQNVTGTNTALSCLLQQLGRR